MSYENKNKIGNVLIASILLFICFVVPVFALTSGNVFRSDEISNNCVNGGDHIRIYDYNHISVGAFPCAGGAGTWANYFNETFNNTTFTEFEQVGTLPCGTFEECSISALAIAEVILRADGWTPAPPTKGWLIMPSTTAQVITGEAVASVGALVGDFWPFVGLFAGVPLAFFIIRRVIKLVPKDDKSK